MTYKRWRLREGIALQDVVHLVESEIAPHYGRLDPEVQLGLESVVGEAEVLAVQHWPDRDAHDRVLEGDDYRLWWDAYAPVLGRWDELVELVEEWKADRLI